MSGLEAFPYGPAHMEGYETERGLLDLRLQMATMKIEIDRLKQEVYMLKDRVWYLEDQNKYWLGTLLWVWNSFKDSILAFTYKKKPLPAANQTDVEAGGGEEVNTEGQEGQGLSMET